VPGAAEPTWKAVGVSAPRVGIAFSAGGKGIFLTGFCLFAVRGGSFSTPRGSRRCVLAEFCHADLGEGGMGQGGWLGLVPSLPAGSRALPSRSLGFESSRDFSPSPPLGQKLTFSAYGARAQAGRRRGCRRGFSVGCLPRVGISLPPVSRCWSRGSGSSAGSGSPLVSPKRSCGAGRGSPCFITRNVTCSSSSSHKQRIYLSAS